MDNLSSLIGNFGRDQQISAAESRLLARTAGNDASKLTKGFESQGVDHQTAARLASQVLRRGTQNH